MADADPPGTHDVMELAGRLGPAVRELVEAGGRLALELRSGGPPPPPLERAIDRFEEVTRGFSADMLHLFAALEQDPVACVTLLLERGGVPAGVLQRTEMERLWRDFAARVHTVCEDREPAPAAGPVCRLTAVEFAAVAVIVNRAVQGRDLDDLASELGLWDGTALATAVAKLEQVLASLDENGGTGRGRQERPT